MQKEVYWQWWPLFGSATGLILALALWPFVVVHSMTGLLFGMLTAFGHFAGWGAAICYRRATRWQRR